MTDRQINIHSRDDIYLDKIIQDKFTGSFMSNSKWLKLIAAIVTNTDIVKECLVKPIWDNNEPHRHLIFDADTEYNFDYYETAMEAMVSGSPTGWYSYKEIEWLDFPKKNQDIKLIQNILKDLGQFQTEETENSLRLYAYLK